MSKLNKTGQYNVGIHIHTEAYHYPVEFLRGLQGTPFFLNWDLDNKNVPATLSDERISRYPHSNAIVVSSKKTKTFPSTSPAMVSRNLDSAQRLNASANKDVGAFLTECWQRKF